MISENFLNFYSSFLIIFSWVFSGWPPLWQNPRVPPQVEQAAAAPTVIYITSTASTSWTVPSNWNSDSNTIEVIGGGGGGHFVASIPGVGGGGGASGAYAIKSNLSLEPETQITIKVGVAGAMATAGGDTYFNATTCADSSVCGKGGGGASGQTGGSAQTGSVGTVNAGANGGTGGPTGPTNGGGGGGGGGAGGPQGAGNAGITATGQDGGAGGQGGGTAGGAGGLANGGAGGNGTEWSPSPAYGSGGGGGGGQGGGNKSDGWGGGSGGTYGAGGGGGGGAGKGGALSGAGKAGTQGIIVITYTPAVTTVAKQGSQTGTLYIDTADNYIGGAFTFQANIGTVNVTSITLTETGTVTADDNLANVELYYETAATCSYDGDETQFSTTQSFTGEEAVFDSDTMVVGTSQVCIYVILDIGSGAGETETISIEINSSSDVTVSSGTISGSFPINLGESTIQQPPPVSLDQYSYRWRNDDGGEGVAWYNADWPYRKLVPVVNSTSTLADYQVRIIVANSTGGNVTCGGNCQPDFDDVFFTVDDGVTPLSFWRESYIASATSTFWVKIPSLPELSATNIFMYYGEADTATLGDGDDTFELFDHFEGTELDPLKWYECDNGPQSVANSEMELRATVTAGEKGVIYSTSTTFTVPAGSTVGYAVKQRAKKNTGYGFYGVAFAAFRAMTGCASENYAYAFLYGQTTTNNQAFSANGNGSNEGLPSVAMAGATDFTYRIYETIWEPNRVRFYYEDILKYTETTYVPTSTSYVYFLEGAGTDAEDRRAYFDWVFVRKIISPEPSIGTAGEQETSGGATWLANENTLAILTAEEQTDNIRVRFLIKNAGGQAGDINYRLQYAGLGSYANCLSVDEEEFADVPTTTGSVVQMAASTYFSDGDGTTNFSGSLTDPTNGYFWIDGKMVASSSNQTAALTLNINKFTELEYIFEFTDEAPDGTSYCFRTAQVVGGVILDLDSYTNIARISTKADVTVASIGQQTASMQIASADNYIGGGFVIREFTASRDVTAITISEQGTIDAQNNLENIELYYDLDTTYPYNCVSESYEGGEQQFGDTVIGGFSSANGTTSFSQTVAISTEQALCIYVVLDVGSGSSVGETIEIQITHPSVDVEVSSGTVGPPSVVAIPGTTELIGLAQVHFRWREDIGGEALGDWLYKKSIGIQNSLGSELTDFQVEIKVGYSGVGGADVSCEGNCRTDFGDIRFINADYNLLFDYWQEKYTSSATSTFWVKIPSLPADSTTTIYMFYGNTNAETTSNGENTFIFYDDFEDGTFTNLWEVIYGYWAEAGEGVLYNWNPPTHPGAKFIRLKNITSSNNDPNVHEYKMKWLSGETGTHLAGTVWHWNTPSPLSAFYRAFWYAAENQLYIRYVDTDLGNSPMSYTASYEEWYNFQLKIKGEGNFHFRIKKIDDTNVLSDDFSDTTRTSGSIGLGGFGGGYMSAHYDDYRIRKYAATEPTVVTTGSQTAGGTGWLAAEDTAASIAKNTNVRVRFLIRNSGSAVNNVNYRLQYAELGGAGTCLLVDSINFADAPTTTGSAVQMTASDWFIGCPENSQASTTPQLSVISGAAFASGKIVEDECNQTASFSLATNYYTEHEFNFKFTDNALDLTAYCFRLVKIDAGEAADLDSYLKIAKITTSGEVSVSCITPLNDDTSAFGEINFNDVYVAWPLATTTVTCSGCENGFSMKIYGTGDTVNPGLYKESAPVDLINSAEEALLEPGVEGYGIQATTTSPSITINPKFLKTGNNVGGLLVGSENAVTVASSSGPVTGQVITIIFMAAVSAANELGNYQDLVTISCTVNSPL